MSPTQAISQRLCNNYETNIYTTMLINVSILVFNFSLNKYQLVHVFNSFNEQKLKSTTQYLISNSNENFAKHIFLKHYFKVIYSSIWKIQNVWCRTRAYKCREPTDLWEPWGKISQQLLQKTLEVWFNIAFRSGTSWNYITVFFLIGKSLQKSIGKIWKD